MATEKLGGPNHDILFQKIEPSRLVPHSIPITVPIPDALHVQLLAIQFF